MAPFLCINFINTKESRTDPAHQVSGYKKSFSKFGYVSKKYVYSNLQNYKVELELDNEQQSLESDYKQLTFGKSIAVNEESTKYRGKEELLV